MSGPTTGPRPSPAARRARALVALLALPAAAAAQAPPPSPLDPRAPMQVGAFYYPEQWPRAQWARDLEGIARLGFDFTHLAEFAWTYLEPAEGRFDFTWLDSAITLAHRAGLRVILGTPSAAPPSWMGARYPEVYRVDERGRRHEHGIRAEVSLANPRYRAFVDRVVTRLAQRYGRDPRVWGWQLDNEPGTFADFSPSARRAFQRWLRRRYGTVTALNAAWGGSFWSTRYGSFAEVLLPNATLAAEDRLSPHALLDLARFQADVTAEFLDGQAAILRRHARPGQWITTNYTNITAGTDPRRTRGLDFPTFTLYPVAGHNVLGGDNYAIGDPTRLMEAAAYYGSLTGTWGIMELQPGQVNWAGVNPQPAPGAVGMWLWHAWGAGAALVGTYRYRHPLRGSEMYHEGIVGPDGVTPSPSGRAFTEAMRAIRAIDRERSPGAPLPAALAARRTALLWSHDNFWDLELQPQTTEWKTWGLRNRLTQAIRGAGAPLAFVGEGDDLRGFPFVVVPAYQLVGEALVARWRRYVEGGGHLVLTARTGHKDERGHLPEGPWGARIADLVGADLDGFDVLPPSARAHVEGAGMRAPWHAWGDLWHPRPGTTVLARYVDGTARGRAAAFTRALGRGSVTVIGVVTDDGALERALLRDVYARAGVAVDDLPPGVFVDWRDGVYVAVNYGTAPFAVPLPPGARVLHGTPVLPPAGVLAWRAPAP